MNKYVITKIIAKQTPWVWLNETPTVSFMFNYTALTRFLPTVSLHHHAASLKASSHFITQVCVHRPLTFIYADSTSRRLMPYLLATDKIPR